MVSNVDKIVTKDEFPVLPLGIFKVQKTLSGNDSLCVGNGHLWNCNGYSGMDSSVPHYSSTNGDFLLEISTPSFGQNNYKYGGGSPYQISSVGNHPDYPYQPSMTNASLVYTLDQGYQFDFKVVTLTYTRDVGSVTGGSGVQQAGSVDPYSTRGGLGLAFPWLGAQANIMRCMWSGMSFKGTISGALAKLAVNPGTSAKSVKNSTAAIDSPKELVPLWPGNFFIQLVREETDITYCRNVFFNSTSPFDKNVVGVMDYGSVWEHDDSFQEIQGNGCMCGWGEGQA